MMRSAALLVCFLSVWLAAENFQFDSVKDQMDYQDILEELDCPKCKDKDLRRSNSPYAKKVRKQVYQAIQQGHSKEAIATNLVERYDYLTYQAPLAATSPMTIVGISFALLFSAAIAVPLSRRHSRQIARKTTSENKENVRLNND